MKLATINYKDLNSRQQENYNFQKLAAVLADYGFNCMWLNDDWQGADFIACHIDGETFLKVQLKGRLTLDKKYIGKGIHIAFRHDTQWYLYPHDELLAIIEAANLISGTQSWKNKGLYSWPTIPQSLIPDLNAYQLR
jgi:hypothetical protein